LDRNNKTKMAKVCSMLMMMASVPVVDGSLRFDPHRTLVAVPENIDTMLALEHKITNGTGFERHDFESIFEDRVEIWASAEHLEHLTSHKVTFSKTTDVGAKNFADEMNRPGGRYMDTVGADPVWDEYCGYDCLTARFAELAAVGGCQFPFELYNIGSTVNGRDIWVAKIGNQGPEVLMAGNIHGDETTGGQLLQRWAYETCTRANNDQDQIARAMQVYYLPMFNPDGFESNRRGNGNNADLNRDFPTPTGGAGSVQPESKALIAFADQHQFDASMMYHGGAIVVNYAYDDCYTSNIVPRPCPPASTSLHARGRDVLPSSEAYSVPLVNNNVRCTVGTGCLVNGAAWYQITGSLQDYEFHFKDTLSMTMEVSSTKRPAASTLPGFYSDNKDSITSFIKYSIPSSQKVA